MSINQKQKNGMVKLDLVPEEIVWEEDDRFQKTIFQPTAR